MLLLLAEEIGQVNQQVEVGIVEAVLVFQVLLALVGDYVGEYALRLESGEMQSAADYTIVESAHINGAHRGDELEGAVVGEG